jgi:hypothetical protein
MQRNKAWVIVALAGALGAIILLAAGLSDVELSAGRSIAPQPRQPAFLSQLFQIGAPMEINIWRIIGIIVLVITPPAVIIVLLSPDLRKRVLSNAIFLAVTMFAIYIMIRQRGDVLEQLSEMLTAPPEQPGAADPLRMVTPDAFITAPPAWLTLTVMAAMVVISLAIAWWMIRRLPPRVDQLDLLAVEAKEAIDHIRAGADLKDTVMRCYFEMSAILQDTYQVERREGMTPREFEARLRAAGVGAPAIRRLTRLFETVRYSTHQAGPEEEQEAINCLTAIIETSERSA